MPHKAERPPEHVTPEQPDALDRERYSRLLELRATAGASCFDRLSHNEHDGLQALNAEGQRLDEILDTDPRYADDFVNVVGLAEQARMHVPGQTRPGDDGRRPCTSCRRDALDLDVSLVLPPQVAA